MFAFCHGHASVGHSAGPSQPWIVAPIPLPGQKRPAWPISSLDVLLIKSLEVSGATAVEFIVIKRVATRLLTQRHGAGCAHQNCWKNIHANPECYKQTTWCIRVCRGCGLSAINASGHARCTFPTHSTYRTTDDRRRKKTTPLELKTALVLTGINGSSTSFRALVDRINDRPGSVALVSLAATGAAPAPAPGDGTGGRVHCGRR